MYLEYAGNILRIHPGYARDLPKLCVKDFENKPTSMLGNVWKVLSIQLKHVECMRITNTSELTTPSGVCTQLFREPCGEESPVFIFERAEGAMLDGANFEATPNWRTVAVQLWDLANQALS